MIRLAVAVVSTLVLLTATVVLAEDVKAPPTPEDLVGQIQGASSQIEQLTKQLERLKETRTRLQGAYQYAVAAQDYAKATEQEEQGECRDTPVDP